MVSIKEEKTKLRADIKAIISSSQGKAIMQNAHVLQEDEKYCCSFLNQMHSYKEAKTVFAYVAMNDEFPTNNLLKRIIKDGKTLALPVVDGKNLIFREVKLLKDEIIPLKKGSYDILEPSDEAPILFPNESKNLAKLLPLLVIVPARAFSNKGERLGHGGGFYDRFFASLFSLSDKAFISLVGVCFSFQILPSIPCGRYDVLVEQVLTEKI
ncbi:MAG: 5-formyltetrahydrofolate cyclo-ligase [Treponema sp.]